LPAITQLSPSATPGRRYGSFAGRIPVVEEGTPIAGPATPATHGRVLRFDELQIPKIYHREPQVFFISFPPLQALDYVLGTEPLAVVEVQGARWAIVAADRVVETPRVEVLLGWDLEGKSVTIITPAIMIRRLQEIAEAEVLLLGPDFESRVDTARLWRYLEHQGRPLPGVTKAQLGLLGGKRWQGPLLIISDGKEQP